MPVKIIDISMKTNVGTPNEAAETGEETEREGPGIFGDIPGVLDAVSHFDAPFFLM